ncbi:MAG: SBBP repeat-containing protein [Ignavibacteria bacterium]|nr:SBBP repeat-containing protein [Ignavibacteria bacterium]
MNLEWMKRYHGSYSGGSNGANAIDVDDSGNVYVTGSSQISSSRFNYVTIKYNKFGDSIWTSKYGNDYNISYDLVVDDSGNVFVAGAANNQI